MNPKSELGRMLDALQRLGAHPIDGSDQTPYTDPPETLTYEGTHPGKYTGFIKESTYKRGDRFGPATMKYDNGDEYDGQWDRDHFHEQGTFSKKNPKRDGYVWQFVGEFEQDFPKSGTLREWLGGGGISETQSDVNFEKSVTMPPASRSFFDISATAF